MAASALVTSAWADKERRVVPPRYDRNPFEPGTQSIQVPDAQVVVDYFRQ